MEEILASIRRIISDDVAAETATPVVEAVAEPAVPATAQPVAEAAASEAAESVATEAERPARRPAVERPAAASIAEPRGFSRPVVTPAPRVAAGYTQTAARRPLAEPLAARAPTSVRPVAAPSVVEKASAEKAAVPVENDDLDAPFAAALLDLALVEKAVQAELATVPLEAFAEAALVDHEESRADEPAASEEPLVSEAAAVSPVADRSVDAAIESRRAEASAGSVQPDPAPTRTVLPQTAPEAVDMQVQAKPATLASRPATAPAAPAVQPPRAPEAATLSEPARLVSSPTNTAVAASFGALARTVASNSRSVEDVVTEAIRPMLKSWLDENLPALVERLVRAEIERVARQG